MASSQGLVAGGQYSTSMQMYRTLLSKKMERAVWKKSIWAEFMGFIKTDRYQKLPKYASSASLRPTGKPIEVLKDFMNGGVDMDIPIFYPLTGQGVSGSKQLLGNEELQKIAYKSVSVNQQRHGIVVVDNKMSKQALQDPRVVAELMQGGQEKLGDWFSRWLAYQPYSAFVQGYGTHQVLATADGGLGKTRKSHPNFYVAGSGRVTFSNTHATYESAVATALNGLTATASDYFSTYVIENLVYVAGRVHRIMPTSVNGMNLYPIVIDSAQAYQLQQDSRWQNRMITAGERSFTNNPVFTGKIAGVYGGALIMIDDTAPNAYINGDGSYSATTSTTGDTSGVCYGQSNFMATPTDTGNRKLAILFGQSAIACGYGSELGFESEEYDYKQKKTEGADIIIGFERSDILDQDGDFSSNTGNKIYENASSLVCATYSPSSSLTWASA